MTKYTLTPAPLLQGGRGGTRWLWSAALAAIAAAGCGGEECDTPCPGFCVEAPPYAAPDPFVPYTVLAVELPDGRMLVVEVDGPTHDDPAVRLADAEKDAAFIAAGCVVLRIPWSGGRRRAAQVRAQLQAIADAAHRRAKA